MRCGFEGWQYHGYQCYELKPNFAFWYILDYSFHIFIQVFPYSEVQNRSDYTFYEIYFQLFRRPTQAYLTLDAWSAADLLNGMFIMYVYYLR